MATKSLRGVFIGGFSSWKQLSCLEVGCWSRLSSAAVPLGPVLTCEVMEMTGGTRVSGVWCWVGRQGLARDSPPRALLTAGVSFSNQRAVVAKASCE